MIEGCVSKTALDALDAKLSSSLAGYEPTRITSLPDEALSSENNPSFYALLLQLMAHSLATQSTASTPTATDPTVVPRVVRRQTPLVNAGYATRVSILSKSIQRFVREQQGSMNIIVLGCGLDVIGIWAHEIQKTMPMPSSQQIFTYEVDALCNAALKANALQRIAFIEPKTSWNMTQRNHDPTTNILFQAYIKCLDDDEYLSYVESEITNYTLLHADLRDATTLHQAFQQTNLDVSLPTLVITELVLAYLGTQGNTHQLLKFISSHLCVSEDSMMLSYEPMGPTNTSYISSRHAYTNVMDGYSMQYFEKLTKAMGKNSNGRHDDTITRFQPLGIDTGSISHRVRSCGFDGPVDCCCAGEAAASLHSTLDSKDVFDEYAALWMHLSSYAIVCACSSSKLNVQKYTRICPWAVPHRAIQGMGMQKVKDYRLKIAAPSKASIFSISAIRVVDEAQVCNIFESTYAQWFQTYPSIKKMVQNALKTDLRSRQLGDSCTIRDRYTKQDGAFWVATITPSVNSKSEGDVNVRRVIGFIGVRNAGHGVFNGTTGMCRYEIVRLVVQERWRNQGIGKALCSTVEEFVRYRRDSESLQPTIVMATTPAVLEEANRMYLSIGFKLLNQVTQKGLLMNTYHLSLDG